MSGKKPSLPRSRLPAMEPTLPETEAMLRCENKRRLLRSFRMATESRWIADWLLTHPTNPFHHHTSIPPDAFDNALAIRAGHRLVNPDPCGNAEPCGSSLGAPAAGPVSAGHDLLLVPVAHSSGRLIGYSFGGLQQTAQQGSDACGYDSRTTPFFPHFVGRFAFDGTTNDLLIVVNRMNEYMTGIMSIKRGDGRTRERACFSVVNGSYGYKALPAKIAGMTTMSERRLASIPKYQFASSGGSGSGESGRRRGEVKTDMGTLRADLAKLERVVKGKFFAPKALRDQMDVDSGELTVRESAQIEGTFDVKDAVGMQVFRDTAGRAYYSYMSSVASQRAAAGEKAGKAPK